MIGTGALTNDITVAHKMQIFAFLFLTLGPFKVIAPFASITKNATPAFSRQLALRATLISSIALLIAGLLGEGILKRYGIPVPILSMSAGIILFIVALLNVIQQFSPQSPRHDPDAVPTLNLAMSPLAFPTIVTPYGIAAVIVFLALNPDMSSKLMIGGIVLGIMVMNLLAMLISRLVYKPLAIVLGILGVILAVVQVALGLQVIYKAILQLVKLGGI